MRSEQFVISKEAFDRLMKSAGAMTTTDYEKLPVAESYEDASPSVGRVKYPEMTMLVKKPLGSEIWKKVIPWHLWDVYSKKLFLTVERLIVQSSSGRVMDIIILCGKELDRGCRHLAVYSEDKHLGMGSIYYTTISEVDDCSITVNIQRLLGERFGLRFYRERDSRVSGYGDCVFPYLSKMKNHESSATVKSFLFVENDVDAPAYVSFVEAASVLDCEGTLEAQRLGIVSTEYDHAAIGFTGKAPEQFFVKNGSSLADESYDLSPYVEGLENVYLLTQASESSVVSSSTETYAMLGMATEICKDLDDSAFRSVITYLRYGSWRLHNAHTVTKWEPDTNVSFVLGDVPEVRVLTIYKSDDDDENFYVESETGRWYIYNYSDTDGGLTAKQLKDFKISGLVDASVLNTNGKGYAFGYMEMNRKLSECGGVEYLKNTAASMGQKIKTLHGTSYLSMINDMRVVWEAAKKLHP